MFPMGYYDYGYGLGYGMSQMVPPPAVVNHQADENIYLAHHESNDGATIALLSFAAIGSLAGLLIARKANKTTKLIDAVTHDLRETATRNAEGILKSAEEAAAEKAAKIELAAKEYAGGIKSEIHALRRTTAEELKKAEKFRLEAEDDVAELRGLIDLTKVKEAELGGHVADFKGRKAELDRLIAEAEGRLRAASTAAPVSSPVASTGAPGTGRITRPGHAEPVSSSTVVTADKTEGVAKTALKKAGNDLDAAEKLFEDGKFGDALPLYENSVKGYESAYNAGKLEADKIPLYAGVLHNAGRCHQGQGNLGAAIGYYDRTLQVVPNDIDSLINKAHCHNQLKQFEAEFKCYETAANAGDEYSMIVSGSIKESQQSYKEAAAFFKMAADKGNPDGFFNLARLSENIDKDYLGALRLYKQSLELYLPLAKDNTKVVERLSVLNDKLRPNAQKHWFACMGAKTPEQIKNLSDPEKAIRDFINDESLTRLLEESNKIVNPAAVDKTVQATAAATLPPAPHVKTNPGLGQPAAQPAPPPAPAKAPAAGASQPTPANVHGTSEELGDTILQPNPMFQALEVPQPLKDAAKELIDRFRPRPTGARPDAKPGRLASALQIIGEGGLADKLKQFAAKGKAAKPGEVVASKAAASGSDVFTPSLAKTGSAEAKVGTDTIIPTGDEAGNVASNAAKVAEPPKPVIEGDGVASDAKQVTEGLNPEAAAKAVEPPNPDMADLDTKTIPTATEEVATDANALAGEATPRPADAAPEPVQSSEVAAPQPAGVAPEAAPAPVTETKTLVEKGMLGNVTLVEEPAPALVKQLVEPSGSQAGLNLTSEAAGKAPEPGVSPNLTGKVGNEAPTALPATEAVPQAAHAAEEAVVDRIQDAKKLFAEGELDAGFAKLDEAVKAGDAEAKAELYLYSKGLILHPDFEVDVKEQYLNRAIDSIIDTSQNGAGGFKEEASQILTDAYESGTLGGVSLPAEGEAFGRINDEILRILSKK